ncbi:MAG: protease complex subunit PrcB family protein [Elusimicrobia bacterium]|nr:protease complex subunit PrcB family protein [Elusimicrobiota bacterium]
MDSFAASKVAGSEQKSDNVKAVMEWKEVMGGLAEGGFHVIKDSQAWSDLWSRVRQDPTPEIDFTKNMVVAVFMGIKPMGGYAIEIVKIVKDKKKWVIHVYERNRGAQGGFVIQAFTSPYHMKVIDRTDLAVEFKKRQ